MSNVNVKFKVTLHEQIRYSLSHIFYSPKLLPTNMQYYCMKVKGKVFPYSLPSVGPGADLGVQAVSPQVT